MDQQIFFDQCDPASKNEKQIIETILPGIKAKIAEYGGPLELLEINQAKEYTAVKYGTLTAFRLRLRGKAQRLSVLRKFAYLIPEEFEKKESSSDPLYCQITLTQNLDSYADLLIRLVAESVNCQPTEWDCCSRYMECSDAKVCVHPDKRFAFQCRYRKILASGKIFYGQNRNID